MSYRRNRPTGVSFLGVLVVLLLISIVAALALTWSQWEGEPPAVAFDRDFTTLGRGSDLNVTISDAGTGLKQVIVILRQGDQQVNLVEESFETRGQQASRDYDLAALIAEKHKVQDGPASIEITATDHANRNFLSGNTTTLVREFRFDLYPPRLELLSGQHYINQGGAECVVYRVSDDTVESGVQVGPHFFPGYELPGSDAGARFALFAFAYNLSPDTPVQVIARDEAGNESVVTPWHRVFAKPFRSRNITLDDAFIQKVVPEILSHTPSIEDQGSLIANYVEINSKLREQNHAFIRELSAQSEGELLWNGAFLQLSNSQVESLFADRRSYVYSGEVVDRQDHVGFDLSVVRQYPIEAANDGRVVLAEYFGIYGNTVLIDHGAGLISLYGHLSSIGVEPGQMVKKSQVIGRSGETGLAGGDHLHFGLYLHGVPVNPTEWWDPKWVQEHVLDRLKPASDGTEPAI